MFCEADAYLSCPCDGPLCSLVHLEADPYVCIFSKEGIFIYYVKRGRSIFVILRDGSLCIIWRETDTYFLWTTRWISILSRSVANPYFHSPGDRYLFAMPRGRCLLHMIHEADACSICSSKQTFVYSTKRIFIMSHKVDAHFLCPRNELSLITPHEADAC